MSAQPPTRAATRSAAQRVRAIGLVSAVFTLLATGMAQAQAGPAAPAAPASVTTPAVDNSAPADITRNDQAADFVQAVGTPNTTVRIADDVNLDLSGLSDIPVAAGVRIIGERDSAYPAGPRLFTTSFPSRLLDIGPNASTPSDNVRVTGIRLDGGQGTGYADGDSAGTTGITSYSSVNVEIDHSEIYGWRGAGVSVRDDLGRISNDSNRNSSTVHVHDDYFHYNQRLSSSGYGVELSYGAYALIDQNVFDYNRHDIAGDGREGTGYLAYRNLVLPHGGVNAVTLGIESHTHIFDMHGRDTCYNFTYYCGPAGEAMDIEYNTFLYTNGTDFKLRGTPSAGAVVSHNVFATSTQFNTAPGGLPIVDNAAMVQTVDTSHPDIHASDNQFGLNTMANDPTVSCDLDGDGAPDRFLATGATWWYNSTLAGRWVYMFTSTTRESGVVLGDVNGDGFCDAQAGSTIVYGTSPLTTSVPTSFYGLTTVPGTHAVTGDFNGDGRTDTALIGGDGVPEIATALSRGDGRVDFADADSPSFTTWAQMPGTQVLAGDFNGDGKTDLALTGAGGRGVSVPVAFSNGDGTFSAVADATADFAGWSALPGAVAVAGDVNHDGKTDITLTGAGGWTTVPVALSNGDGTFRVVNGSNPDIAAWAAMPGTKVLSGDFNGDGRADFALTGAGGRGVSVPLALSNGDGTFSAVADATADFAGWSALPGAVAVAGDVNHDGKTDITLTGVGGWTSVPVALSNGDGSFTTVNGSNPDIAAWAAMPGTKVLSGDFNGDGRADFALTGAGGREVSVPVAFSNGDGTFSAVADATADFAVWSAAPDAIAVAGDFDHDGRSDLELTGVNGWFTMPTAFSQGDGSFRVTNLASPQ